MKLKTERNGTTFVAVSTYLDPANKAYIIKMSKKEKRPFYIVLNELIKKAKV
jgi:hypothetical protein